MEGGKDRCRRSWQKVARTDVGHYAAERFLDVVVASRQVIRGQRIPYTPSDTPAMWTGNERSNAESPIWRPTPL